MTNEEFIEQIISITEEFAKEKGMSISYVTPNASINDERLIYKKLETPLDSAFHYHIDTLDRKNFSLRFRTYDGLNLLVVIDNGAHSIILGQNLQMQSEFYLGEPRREIPYLDSLFKNIDGNTFTEKFKNYLDKMWQTRFM